MPTYSVKLSDGRTVRLESDQEPTEDEVLSAIGEPALPSGDISGAMMVAPNPFASDQPWSRAVDVGAPPPQTPPLDTASTLALGGVGLQEGFHGLGEQGWSLAQALTEPIAEFGPVALTPRGLQLTSVARARAKEARETALEARKAAERIAPLGTELEEAGGAPIVRTVGQAIPSIAPALATGLLGAAAPIVAGGLQAGGATLSEAQSVFEQQPEQRRATWLPNREFWDAAAPAALDAVQTAALTAVAGKIFGPGIEGATIPVKRAVVKNAVANHAKQALGEALEEGAQQFVSDYVVAGMSYNPDITFEQAFDNAIKAGAAGGIVGLGVTSAVSASQQQPQLERTQDALHPESTAVPRDVQQPEVAQESTEQVPATSGSEEVAQALTPEAQLEADKVLFKSVQDRIKALVSTGDSSSPELKELLRQNEEIKNRYDGMPPGQTSPARKTMVEQQAEMAAKEKGVEPSEETKKQEEEVLTPTPETAAAEPTGMGAATPSEFQPPKPFTTSNKNAVVDQERKERGLPPMMDLARQGNQDAWDSAMRQIDDNPQIQDELIAELAANPRALTATENAMLMHRRIDLRNEYEKALLRWRLAFEGNDIVLAGEESQRVRDWSAKLSDLEDITKATGAESGRSLQARKMMANEDYSLAAMELRAMESKGRNLTPEEHIQLILAQQRILELENRLLELEGQREAKEVEAATTETVKAVAAEAPKEAKSKDFDIDREEQLLSGIKAKVAKGQTNDITSLVQQLARVFWRRGIRGREPMIDALHDTLKLVIPTFTREDTKRAFSGYGNFKPLSKEEIDVGLRDLRGQTQQVLKMEALEARKPLEKTGQERRVPTDEERRLIKQVNELKRKYGVVVTDPETQLKSALAARKTYYEHRIADLKHEIETRQRIVKSKTASPTDAALDALIAEYERLKSEHEQIFTKPGMTDEQRLKQAIAAAQRNQAHWEVRLENAEKGIFDKRVPGRKVTSAELELIQAETAAIREHVKELEALSKPKKSKEEIALQSLKTRMKSREAEFRRRIAAKDFATKVRQPVNLDAEGLKLKAELDLAKEAFETEREKDRWARMNVFQKTRRKIADVYDAARALMTTGEFSFILRQGKMNVLSHPIRSAKALPNMFKALLASEQRAREIDLETLNDPDADAARQAKLFLMDDTTQRLSRKEEILMGRLVGKIPVVRNFNQAAQVFLNKIRLDTFKAMRKSLTKSGTTTPEEDKQIAMFVNESTGRGGLGKAAPMGVGLGRVFFAPRYWASRLQLLAGHSMWGGTMRTRRIIATEYARSLVGLGLYYTLLATLFSDKDDPEKGEIELDPRSTDFGKIKIGNSRLDPLAGLSQQAVLGARTGLAGVNAIARTEIPEKKKLSGDLVRISGKDVPYGGEKWTDIVARHIRGKLHPVPSSIANLFDQTDLGGDEATVINQTQNMVAPITYMDIYAALKEQDLDDATALALLGLLGEGIQTYKEKEK